MKQDLTKIWEHLAMTGSLSLSAAWYSTDDQAQWWARLSDSELEDPTSNASREITLLEHLLETDYPQELIKEHGAVRILDIGSGTGEKAVRILNKFPKSCIQYYLIDHSAPLRSIARKRIDERVTKHERFEDPFLDLDGGSPTLQKFYEMVDSYRFRDVYHHLTMQPYGGILPMFLFGLDKSIEESLIPIRKMHNELNETLKNILLHPDIEQAKQMFLTIRSRFKHPGVIRHFRTHLEQYIEAIYQQRPDDIKKHSDICNQALYFLDPSSDIEEYFKRSEPVDGLFVQDLSLDIAENIHCLDAVFNNPYSRPCSNLVMILGNTLANISEQSLLSKLYTVSPPGTRFLFGVENCPTHDMPVEEGNAYTHLTKKYGDPKQTVGENPVDEFLRTMTRGLSIPDEALSFHVDFCDAILFMEYHVKAKEGIEVPHPGYGKQILKIPYGETIPVASSNKFMPGDLNRTLEHLGYTDIHCSDSLNYQLIQARKPEVDRS